MLFAMDAKWWDHHIKEVRNSVQSELVSSSSQVTKHGIYKVMINGRPLDPFGNSGAASVNLSHVMGAKKIILLGFDCQRTGGKAHWFGDHPVMLGNAGSLDKWPEQFNKLSKAMKGVDVVNCTRETALECFPCEPLESVI